jgi:hypothetical protein
MKEKRMMQRFTLEVPARISFAEHPQQKGIELLTRNISAGGAFFKTDDPLPVGTELTMEVLLPLNGIKKVKGEKSAVKLTGSIIRSEEKGMAVCFDEEYQILPLQT